MSRARISVAGGVGLDLGLELVDGLRPGAPDGLIGVHDDPLQADRVAGASGVAGHGTLARLRFRALGTGAATVAVATSRIEDAEGYELASVAGTASEVDIRAPEESGLTVLETVEPIEPAAEPDGGS